MTTRKPLTRYVLDGQCVYLAADVDAALAERDARIAQLERQISAKPRKPFCGWCGGPHWASQCALIHGESDQ